MDVVEVWVEACDLPQPRFGIRADRQNDIVVMPEKAALTSLRMYCRA